MKNRLLAAFIVVLALFAMTACGNNDNDESNQATNNEKNNETSENDDESNNNNEEDTVMLKIGETGDMKTTVAEYEMTPTNVEVFDERDGEKPTNEGDVFVLIDFTLKNTDTEAIDPEDIIDLGVILEGDEFTSDNYWGMDYDFVEELEEEIEPEEEVTGQLLFELDPSDSYELHFDGGLVAEDIRYIWEIDKSDI